MEIKGRKFAVVGFGITGKAIANFITSMGGTVLISDRNPQREEEIKRLGYEYQIENSPEFLSRADVIVVSPGVPWNAPFLEELRNMGKRVMGDIDFSIPFVKGKLIGITGSNGKSTTVALTAHILKTAGFKAEACGNIGNPLINLAGKDHDFLVLELSSYQLEASSPSVYISSILNCTPDHLNRHGSFDAYCTAKERLLELQKEGFSVLNLDDPRSEIWDKKSRVEKYFFSSRKEVAKGITIKDFRAFEGENLAFDGKRMKLIGTHNMENAAAAFLIAKLAGAAEEKIREGIYSFEPLEHRMELFTYCQGKPFINDSKATNIDAVRRALQSLTGKYAIIMGGQGKGESYGELSDLMREKAVFIVAIGEEKLKIKEDLGRTSEVVVASSLEEAVDLVFERLNEVDGVILSPACASFDMFSNFEERGRRFKELVLRRCNE